MKFSPPLSANSPVLRERVSELIFQTEKNIVLVCAPAGYGKTTAMSQIYRQFVAQGTPAIWLTLDSADNNIDRFGMYVGAALSLSLPELNIESQVTTEVMGEISISSVRLYRLLDELPLINGAFVFFLDEFECITDPDVLGFVDRLLCVLGKGQRMVIGSRRNPSLHLGRLRVQGHLLELDIEQMRFSIEETRNFVRQRIPTEISELELDKYHARTEGWPAALQLATTAATLRKPSAEFAPREFYGSDKGIADYFAEDVLARLPEDQQVFLLRSSIFDMFCPSLCDAVFRVTDSEILISKSLSENLFLSKIDADGDWYRYHPLFLEFLRKQYDQGLRRELSTLHLGAARWFASCGRMSHAITHALAAGDLTLAANYMEQSAMTYLRSGQLNAICQWLKLLPESYLDNQPRRLIASAYATTFLHRYGEASQLLAKLDLVTVELKDIAGDLLMTKVMLAVWTDKLREAFDIALENQRSLDSSNPYVVGFIHNALAFHHQTQGDYYFALQNVALAKQTLTSINALHGLTYARSIEGAISLLQSDTVNAYSRASTALTQAIDSGHRYSSSSPVAASYLAEVLYETNNLDDVEALADDYLAVIRETCIPDQIIISHRAAARVHVLRNRHESALEVLNLLQDLGDARGIPRLAAAARLERIWIALVERDVATANRLLPLATAEHIWRPFANMWTYAEDINDPEIATFRLELMSGNSSSIVAKIEQAINRAGAANRRRRQLSLQCLLAQAHELSRRRHRALEILERTLIAGQLGGVIRVFADESWYLLPLLQALALRSSAVSPAYIAKLTEAATYTVMRAAKIPFERQADVNALLSPRETLILQLLAEGHSNKVLSAKLNLAESTIETHLHRINVKLGSRNRTQAVGKGRELGLI
ncbi:MAG: LuxR C-terminal-related transcriptional regulator [Proteobacteria bacterium]|nr:LuxR C-terminal-related transcriptional regulator [Pseudomonadota bacterium]